MVKIREEGEEQYMTMQYGKDVIFKFAEWIEKNVGGWVEIDYKYATKVGKVIVRECTEEEIDILINYEIGLTHLVKDDE